MTRRVGALEILTLGEPSIKGIWSGGTSRTISIPPVRSSEIWVGNLFNGPENDGLDRWCSLPIISFGLQDHVNSPLPFLKPIGPRSIGIGGDMIRPLFFHPFCRKHLIVGQTIESYGVGFLSKNPDRVVVQNFDLLYPGNGGALAALRIPSSFYRELNAFGVEKLSVIEPDALRSLNSQVLSSTSLQDSARWGFTFRVF